MVGFCFRGVVCSVALTGTPRSYRDSATADGGGAYLDVYWFQS